MADLLLTLLGKDELSAAFGSAAGAVTALTAELGHMVKAAAESERVGAQLKVTAGELTQGLKAQAEAQAALYAVSDEQIQQMDAIQLRYGANASELGKYNKAILDYAAATGNDATSATEALVRGVEKGTGHIKALGIEFKATGDFATDLAAATEALGRRFGGAASARADTFEGQVNAAKEAVNDLEEAFGNLVLQFERKTGVISTATQLIRGFRKAVEGGKTLDFVAGAAKDILGPATAVIPGLDLATNLFGSGKGAMEQMDEQDAAAARDEAAAFEQQLRTPKKTHGVGKDNRAEQQKDALDKLLKQQEEFRLKMAKELEDEREDARRAAERAINDAKKHEYEMEKIQEKELRDRERQEAQYNAQKSREMEREAQRLEKEEARMAQAGERLGQALVTAFTDQLNELASGGEFDVGSFFGSLFEGILGFFGSLLPGGGIASALVGGIGKLGGGGIRAAGKAAKRHHDGAWIESFHSGGWPSMGGDEQPAILQTGERVLSRREVSRMGGQSGVDRAAQGGGGGLTVVVNAVDQESVRGLFEGRGGRAMRDAVRLGRGPIGQLIKAGGY